MAKLMLIGSVAQLEIRPNQDDYGTLQATCAGHKGAVDLMYQKASFSAPACDWSETYDDLNEAMDCAEDHAEGKR